MRTQILTKKKKLNKKNKFLGQKTLQKIIQSTRLKKNKLGWELVLTDLIR
jgi:hypothetical protein